MEKKNSWPRRDLNTQPSDLESDALPLRHGVTCQIEDPVSSYIRFNILPVRLIFVYIGRSKCWFFGYLGWNSKLAQK